MNNLTIGSDSKWNSIETPLMITCYKYLSRNLDRAIHHGIKDVLMGLICINLGNSISEGYQYE